MASRRSRSQIPLQESKELIYFPSPGKSCSAYNEILFANQNQSSSTALSSPDLVVLQPFQPWNWKTLLKQINAMANSNFGYNLDFCSPNKIKYWMRERTTISQKKLRKISNSSICLWHLDLCSPKQVNIFVAVFFQYFCTGSMLLLVFWVKMWKSFNKKVWIPCGQLQHLCQCAKWAMEGGSWWSSRGNFRSPQD